MKKTTKILMGILCLCPLLLLTACDSTTYYTINVYWSDWNYGSVVGNYSDPRQLEGTTMTLIATENTSTASTNPFICWIKNNNNVVSTNRELQLTYNSSTAGDYVAVFEETNPSGMTYMSLDNLVVEGLDSYSNVTFSTANFDFNGSTLTSAHFVSNNLESTYSSTVPTYKEDGTYLDAYHQTYIRYNYEVNMNFSDIGTANAKDIIAPQADKEENEPLKNAIENMNKYDSITLSRRATGYYDYYGEYVGNDEILNIYYMGKDSETPGIYSQALIVDEAGDEMIKPTSPSLNDYYLRPSETTGMLRVYTYSTASQAFSKNASGYSGIDNQFTYDEAAFSLQGVSANIFNYVEDSSDPRGGYYVPTLDNLPYVVSDLFMSTFDIFTPVSGGFVTDVKIYVNEDETCIDSVVATYNQRNQYTGTFRVELSDLGNSHPSFDINLAA